MTDRLPLPRRYCPPVTVWFAGSVKVTAQPHRRPAQLSARPTADRPGIGDVAGVARRKPASRRQRAPVSSVKLSEAVPVLPKVSVWLATMVWAPSASPLGVNDQAPVASAVTVVAMALPSMLKCTTVLASPVPVSASFEVMWSLDEAAGVDGQRLGQCRTGGAQVEDHRPAAAGIAGGVGIPGDDAVAAIARQRDAGAPAAVAADRRGAQRRRAAIVEQRHRGAGVGRSGNGLRRLVGSAARRCRSPPPVRWYRA